MIGGAAWWKWVIFALGMIVFPSLFAAWFMLILLRNLAYLMGVGL